MNTENRRSSSLEVAESVDDFVCVGFGFGNSFHQVSVASEIERAYGCSKHW